jgi:GNAT superfamily N-acetyltransferase
LIFKATVNEIREITEMATRFEECTNHVLVDVDHSVKNYTRFITEGIGAMFGVRIDGEVVGGLGCIKSYDLHYPRMLAVETFWFVLPEHRGFGMQLWEEFEKWAKEEKCDYMAMIHLSDSSPEILERLYVRKGYELIEKHYLKKV